MNNIVVTRLSDVLAAKIDGVASHVENMPVDEGRAILKTRLDHATQPAFVYRHE